MIPMFTSGWPSFARSDAIRMSHARASSQPPPRAYPLIAARIGLLHAAIASPSLRPASEKDRISSAVRPTISLMSAPAPNARSPAPVRLIAPARAGVDRPGWAAGAFWVYAYSSALTGTAIPGPLRMDVTGSESVMVNGSSYPTYHVAATLTIPFGSLTLTLPADIWYSSSTLAIVKIVATVNLTFGTVSANSHIAISGNPPQIIQWPLTAGASWDSSTVVWAVTTNSTGAVTYTSAPLTTHFEVQTDASITVPAGTFTTS